MGKCASAPREERKITTAPSRPSGVSSVDCLEAESDKAAAVISRESPKNKKNKVQISTDENLLSFNMVEEKDGEESSDDEDNDLMEIVHPEKFQKHAKNENFPVAVVTTNAVLGRTIAEIGLTREYTHHHYATPYGPQNRHKNNNQHRNANPPRKVQITCHKKKHNDINYVILDRGAFIGRQYFLNNFDPNTKYYVTPAVEDEIRDKQSRQFLNSFPYEIIRKEPDPKSVSYVNKFISKNKDLALKSLSKADRQIIALAHTLELEYGQNGADRNNQHQQSIRAQPERAMSVIDRNKDNTDNKQKQGKQPKKSKTGRVHTELNGIPDTGHHLSQLKKDIPFRFGDYMASSQSQYGDKYGKPTPYELANHPPSPVRVPTIPKATESKNDESENQKIKYNPNIKAMTECAHGYIDEKETEELQSPLSFKANLKSLEYQLIQCRRSAICIEQDLYNTINKAAAVTSTYNQEGQQQSVTDQIEIRKMVNLLDSMIVTQLCHRQKISTIMSKLQEMKNSK